MPSAERSRSVLAPVAAVVLAAAVAGVVALTISPKIPFDSDEANHANLALRQFQDLARGDFADFLRHSYRTGQFPFFHGWTVVPWFAALGTTLYAARVAQGLHFVVGAAATTYAAWRASGDDRRAGGLAGVLFAVSPALAVYSGLCMLETPGAAATAVTFAALAAALRAEGRRAAWLDVAVAGAVLATWFTKLNYGIWIVPAVGVGYLVAALEPGKGRRAALGMLRALGVVAVVLGAWYSGASARAAFAGFLTNPSQAVPVVEDAPAFHLPSLRAENFFGYFGLVAGDYHAHWTLGAVVLVFAAAGVVRGARARNPVVLAAAACVAFTWATLSTGVREYPLARFIASALPALWICAAFGAAPLLARARDGLAAYAVERLAVLAAAAAGVLHVRVDLPREYEVGPEFRPFFAFLADTIPRPSSVLVLNYTDHTSARMLDWQLATQPGASYRDFDVRGLIAERIYESDHAFAKWMDDAPRRWGDASWSSVVVLVTTGADYPDAAVVQPQTVELWRKAFEARRPGRLELVGSKEWPAWDLKASVWRDLRPPPHVGTAPAGR